MHTKSAPAPAPVEMTLPRLTLFDCFRLEVGGGRADLSATLQRLVAYLAVHGPASRSALAGTLWPDGTEDKALASLRTAVWRLRREHAGVLEAHHDRVALAGTVWVDARAFGDLARGVLNDDRQVEAGLLDGVGDWRGELLPGWDDDWVVFERERYRQLRLHLLEALSAQLLARHRYTAALEAGLDAVACEPLRESSHRAVIAVHLAEGNLVEAWRHYEDFRALVSSELGVLPTQRLRELVDPVPAPRERGAPGVTRL